MLGQRRRRWPNIKTTLTQCCFWRGDLSWESDDLEFHLYAAFHGRWSCCCDACPETSVMDETNRTSAHLFTKWGRPLHLSRSEQSLPPYCAVTDFRRQNLTSIDVRIWRIKSIPALVVDIGIQIKRNELTLWDIYVDFKLRRTLRSPWFI